MIEEREVVENQNVNMVFILYAISFVPYFLLPYIAIFGYESSFMFSETEMFYGIVAMFLFVLDHIYLIPIATFWGVVQIAVFIKMKKKFEKWQKKYLLIQVILIAGLIGVTCIFYNMLLFIETP